jgi:hypothetical protein
MAKVRHLKKYKAKKHGKKKTSWKKMTGLAAAAVGLVAAAVLGRKTLKKFRKSA